jgi:nucleoside-diphosphate-sugar epimerase
LEPQSPYAASKLAADKMMDAFHRTFGLPVTILRPFNTFPPGSPRVRSFPRSSRKRWRATRSGSAQWTREGT